MPTFVTAATPPLWDHENCSNGGPLPSCLDLDSAVFCFEQAIEFIADDELVEVTPQNVRLRKRVLRPSDRPKRKEA